MTGKDLFREIGNIDDNYVVEAENYKKRTVITPVFKRTLVSAACLCFCFVAGFGVYLFNGGAHNASNEADMAIEKYGLREESLLEVADDTETANQAASTGADKEESRASSGNATPESVKEETEKATDDSIKKEFAEVSSQTSNAVFDLASEKKRLGEYSNDYQKLLKEENAYVVFHGTAEAGQELWDTFYQSVNAGKEAGIDIIQFTIEGDAVITYVAFDGSSFKILKDNSRDEFRGNGVEYYEAAYKYLVRQEEKLSDGTKAVQYILTDDEKNAKQGYVIIYVNEE